MGEEPRETRQLMRVTFRIVGPMKRSTFQREQPDFAEEALSDVLHWSWSTRLQIDRLRQDVSVEFAAWSAKHPHRARRAFSATSCDEHLLLVCAANLDRALDRVPKNLRRQLSISKQSRRALWLLRNIYEHWDELRRHLRAGTSDSKGTIAKLRKEFPAADPWSFTIDHRADEIVLADIVALRALLKELRGLEAGVLRLERSRKRDRAGHSEKASKPGA